MLSDFFLAGLLAARALAAPEAFSTDVPKLKCENQGDTSQAFEAHRVFVVRERNHTGPHPQINVDVYMHVLLGSVEDASLTVDLLNGQVNSLNKDFKPANISFTLRNTEMIDDARLANGPNDEMKKMLHAGTNSALNIYYVKNLDDGGQGMATLPTRMLEGPDGPVLDGCLLNKFVAVVDGGRTLTHEIGHWFGLLHTYQDRCEGGDDFIDDTPPTPSSCYHKLLSCPGRNFMGVSSRGAEFTAGQITRMHSFWAEYRSKNTTKAETTALTAMEPLPRNQTRLPFYPDPPNRRLAYQSCRPKPDGSVGEKREEYCGTEAFCRWKLYELVGQKFHDEADCLGARTRLERAPWMKPQKEERSKQLCADGNSSVSEIVCGTEAYCKAYAQGSRQIVDARNVTGRGQFSSATDCLASRQDPPASETAPSPSPGPPADQPDWKPFFEPAKGDGTVEACGEPLLGDANALSEECLGTFKFCEERYGEVEEKFETALDCKDSRQMV